MKIYSINNANRNSTSLSAKANLGRTLKSFKIDESKDLILEIWRNSENNVNYISSYVSKNTKNGKKIVIPETYSSTWGKGQGALSNKEKVDYADILSGYIVQFRDSILNSGDGIKFSDGILRAQQFISSTIKELFL